MRFRLEDWHNGWYEVEVCLRSDEIDEFIDRLRMVQADPEQHFHLNSDFSGDGGVGKLTFCQQGPDEAGNAALSSRAYVPGEIIPEKGRS